MKKSAYSIIFICIALSLICVYAYRQWQYKIVKTEIVPVQKGDSSKGFGMFDGIPWVPLTAFKDKNSKRYYITANKLDKGEGNNNDVVIRITLPETWVIGDQAHEVSIKKPHWKFWGALGNGTTTISGLDNNRISLTFDYHIDDKNWITGVIGVDL